MDAFQFVVGIYDEHENSISYKGMIENGKKIPDFTVDAMATNRLASWCIRNEKEIFINDMDREFSNYWPINRFLLRLAIQSSNICSVEIKQQSYRVITVRTINANVYQQHHLHILKTVGNFIVRTTALSKLSQTPFLPAAGEAKQWKWNEEGALSPKSLRALALLTQREKEVLFLLVSGLPNKMIAEKLFVSAGTIKTHTLNIYQKMDVANRSSAIVKSISVWDGSHKSTIWYR
jgi:DNA-binding CsgD family transcriptional regulator